MPSGFEVLGIVEFYFVGTFTAAGLCIYRHVDHFHMQDKFGRNVVYDVQLPSEESSYREEVLTCEDDSTNLASIVIVDTYVHRVQR